MYLTEQKNTGMKLLSALLKNVTDAKISLLINVYRDSDTNKLRSSDQKHYVIDIEGMLAMYETFGKRAS